MTPCTVSNNSRICSAAVLVLIGDKLGLYRALAEGPATSAEIAERAGTAERYTREWLAAQAAAGYVDYDAASGRYSMSPEQALAFAEEGSPAFVPGAFQIISSMFRDEPKMGKTFPKSTFIGFD